MSRMQKRHLVIILSIVLASMYALVLARLYMENKQPPVVRIAPAVHYRRSNTSFSAPSFRSVTQGKTSAFEVAVPLKKTSLERVYGGGINQIVYASSSQTAHSVGGGYANAVSSPQTGRSHSKKSTPVMQMATFSTSPLVAVNTTYSLESSAYDAPARVVHRVSRPPFPLDPGESGGGYGPQFPEEPGEDPCLHCLDADHDGICDVCGHSLLGCGCDDCRCPLDDVPLEAILLMLIGYGIVKKRSLRADCR